MILRMVWSHLLKIRIRVFCLQVLLKLLNRWQNLLLVFPPLRGWNYLDRYHLSWWVAHTLILSQSAFTQYSLNTIIKQAIIDIWSKILNGKRLEMMLLGLLSNVHKDFTLSLKGFPNLNATYRFGITHGFFRLFDWGNFWRWTHFTAHLRTQVESIKLRVIMKGISDYLRLQTDRVITWGWFPVISLDNLSHNAGSLRGKLGQLKEQTFIHLQ